jgi:hypothetical protein
MLKVHRKFVIKFVNRSVKGLDMGLRIILKWIFGAYCVKLWAGSGSPQISSQLSGFCGKGNESSNVASTAGIFFTDRMVVSDCQCTHLWSCTENGLLLPIAAFRGICSEFCGIAVEYFEPTIHCI